MRRIFLASLLLSLGLLAAPAGAAVLEGQRFDERARLDRHELQLNGLGLRAAYIFKAFVAALYLPEKTSEPQQILDRDVPRRLQLRMLLSVDANEIKKALVRGMQKNANATEWAALQARAETFSRTIDTIGVAREGDTINLDYLPGQGLRLAINEVPRGPAIAGADFYQALLGIFVGEHPVDTRLKKGLLGQ
jgi:hypothetical protein